LPACSLQFMWMWGEKWKIKFLNLVQIDAGKACCVGLNSADLFPLCVTTIVTSLRHRKHTIACIVYSIPVNKQLRFRRTESIVSRRGLRWHRWQQNHRTGPPPCVRWYQQTILGQNPRQFWVAQWNGTRGTYPEGGVTSSVLRHPTPEAPHDSKTTGRVAMRSHSDDASSLNTMEHERALKAVDCLFALAGVGLGRASAKP